MELGSVSETKKRERMLLNCMRLNGFCTYASNGQFCERLVGADAHELNLGMTLPSSCATVMPSMIGMWMSRNTMSNMFTSAT